MENQDFQARKEAYCRLYNRVQSILLKKNVRSNIIKAILEYPFIAAPETLKKLNVVIISVRQGYESTEERQDYRTEFRITYRGREISMDIRKSKDNYDKDRKPRCFNYNIYRHITKDYQKAKKKNQEVLQV